MSKVRASSDLPTEAEVIGHILAGLDVLGRVEGYALEVPSHGRARTDVVVFRKRDVIGIEAKVLDWKAALRQAALNRYCVHASYIALWHSAIKEDVVNAASAHGVGILSVTPTRVSVVTRAPKTIPHRTLLDRVRSAYPRGPK